MLKGKTTIELTDVNTGEKKVYEHHNTITKSLEKLLKDHGSLMDPRYLFTSNGVSSLYPYRTNALGGLLLFDNEIDPKNGETIFAPTSASMVGCGVYDKTSTNNVRGSYNSSESYYNSQEKSMKYVYDFATNQANGTIKSVCLTSAAGGYGGYENENNVCTLSDDSNNFAYARFACTPTLTIGERVLFAIDLTNDKCYYHNITSITNIDVYTYNAGLYNKRIFHNPLNAGKELSKTSYNIDINSTNYTAGFFDQKHNTLHVIGHTSYNWANGVTLKVSKIDLTNGTVENYTLTNDSGNTIMLFHNSSSEPKSWSVYALIYDNIFYFYQNKSSEYVYKMDIVNPDNNKSLAVPLNYASMFVYGERIAFTDLDRTINISNSNIVYVYNPETDILTKSGLHSHVMTENTNGFECADIVPCIDTDGLIVYRIGRTSNNFYYKFYTLNPYLATINNLETPITKTNTNTMKVIYTITEE